MKLYVTRSPPLLSESHSAFDNNGLPHTSWFIELIIGTRSGITAASFGVVGAVFALQFFSDVPKVRNDICQVRYFPLEV